MPQRRFREMSDDDLYADWVELIERVYSEFTSLAWNRRVFRDIRHVSAKNPHLQGATGYLWDWMSLNYVAGAAMSLRRELDRQTDTLNLRHLLHEIEARPTILSRRRYYDQWGSLRGRDGMQAVMDRGFRESSFELYPLVRFPDEPLRDHLDPAAVQGDRHRLELETELVQLYIEQTVAHRTRGTPDTITFKQFHDAIDTDRRVKSAKYR